MNSDMLQNPTFLATVFVRLIILVVGLFGNSLVVVAVWKKSSLRTTTNLLLLNLAISDLTTQVFATLMFIPEFTTLREGPSSDFLCIVFVSSNVPLTTTFVSILTLTVLAVERYHAIVKPMRNGIRLREDTVKYAFLGVWLTGIVLALPLYIFGRYDKESGKCLHFWKHESVLRFQCYKIFLAVVTVFLPFFLISFCYGQILRELYFKNKVGPQNIAVQQETSEKRRLFKISLTVTGVFALFLFPLAICTGLSDDMGNTCKVSRIVFFSQAGFNPLIYSFQSPNFRQAFKEIVFCRS